MYGRAMASWVGPIVSVADVSLVTWVPFTLTNAVESVTCVPLFAPVETLLGWGPLEKNGCSYAQRVPL